MVKVTSEGVFTFDGSKTTVLKAILSISSEKAFEKGMGQVNKLAMEVWPY
jgi:hypothetical protein